MFKIEDNLLYKVETQVKFKDNLKQAYFWKFTDYTHCGNWNKGRRLKHLFSACNLTRTFKKGWMMFGILLTIDNELHFSQKPKTNMFFILCLTLVSSLAASALNSTPSLNLRAFSTKLTLVTGEKFRAKKLEHDKILNLIHKEKWNIILTTIYTYPS